MGSSIIETLGILKDVIHKELSGADKKSRFQNSLDLSEKE